LFLKPVNVGAAAQFQIGALALGVAAFKGHAVDGAHVVDVDGVPVGRGAVGDLVDGGEVGQDVGVDVIGHILLIDLAQRRVDGDGGVVIRQGDVIGGGHAFQVAVLVKPVGVVEIRQVIVGGLIHGGLGGGGFGGSGLRRGSALGGAAAARQCGGQAYSQQAGGGAQEYFLFHGVLLYK